MKVIIVEPFTNPYTKEIKGDLKSMQAIVGGYIEAVYPFDDPDVALVCNEEGKLEGLTPNRFLLNRNNGVCDFICGDFFLCYAPADSENFESMPDNLIQKYIEKFSAKGVRL
ncbi:DUF3846 domain-containing protein [Ruminococcus sp.]|uniref:DUF3846 domain-containing protein n=1 Tax=Ruminococcus sp. TaxID=41978 RepID=UPI0038664BBC